MLLKRIAILAALTAITTTSVTLAAEPKPLKILVVAGGCCHDYGTQTKLLKEGIEARINSEVTIEYNPSTGTDTVFKVYESDDWATGYDLILHDECSAKVTDKVYVNRILAAHKAGVPAVNLHCAMHSYRWGDYRSPVEVGADNAGWYEMLGLQSSGHGPKIPIDLSFTNKDHPITIGMKGWTTVNEELYNNIRVHDGAEALVTGVQMQPPRKKELQANPNAKAKKSTAVVAWTNLYGPNKTRIFSTSLGHMNETVADGRYMDLVTRGILWATDHIDESGMAKDGYAK